MISGTHALGLLCGVLGNVWNDVSHVLQKLGQVG